ncbi:MAG: large subunit ribosomal protein L17 [Candidatus Berkelbacteria bacterium Licking1014_2]|uniref:50S ribosomal protein L17 n=1 Tax=Candidatus Berkelbacteria bacterium Licking1014_2 TaxID=2017146 RepID=A0A554LX82_9BACT|nr:MAG: large subunit ribosomal protein L17 [Candidatus Berkelbacteria bacterium Licking1014_2]
MKKTFKLSRRKSSRQLMLRNLATSLLLYEKITTTVSKAKAVRPLLEKIISAGKKNDLVARRRLLSILLDKNAVAKTLEVLSPRYKNVTGGYLEIIRINERLGDGAPMAILQLKKMKIDKKEEEKDDQNKQV